MFKKPIAIIFGAGATKGAFDDKKIPPPVDLDFFDVAKQLEGRGTPNLVKKVLRSVWDLYNTNNGVGLEQYYRDIETREIITKFAKTSNQPKNWKRRRRDLEELIRRVYIHTTCDFMGKHANPKESDLHGKILALLKTGDTIITFNYDMLIEESFPVESKLWTPADGYGIAVSGREFDWCRKYVKQKKCHDKSKVFLLKLHGSLNWTLYNNKNIRLKERPYVIRANHEEKVSVLAPGWNKPIDKNPYKIFWRTARLRLENCRTLIIVGYSLPETDLLAQALFAEVVRTRAQRKKKSIKELHLIDPNERVKSKFTNLFMAALGPTGKVFKYGTMGEFINKNELSGKK